MLSAACALAQAGQGGTTRSPSRAAVDTAALRRTLDSLAGAHHGTVGYAVLDLDGGERLSRRGDETFPTASLIKVADPRHRVRPRRAAASSRSTIRLTVLSIDKVPGSGQLQFLHDGAEITVHDAAWLMSTLSDNTATNLLLDRIIIRRVWDKMEALGLQHTKVHSKTFLRNSSVAMDSSVKYGLGVTTPNEMARLFELLARGKRRESGGRLRDARHPRAQRGHADAAAVRGRRARRAQDRRHRRGSHGVLALLPRVARCGVRADEGERRPALGDRHRAAGHDGTNGRGSRQGMGAGAGSEIDALTC